MSWRSKGLWHLGGGAAVSTPPVDSQPHHNCCFNFLPWLRAEPFAGEEKQAEKHFGLGCCELFRFPCPTSGRAGTVIPGGNLCRKLSALFLTHCGKILSQRLRIHSLGQLGVEAQGSITHPLKRQRRAPESPSLRLFQGEDLALPCRKQLQ